MNPLRLTGAQWHVAEAQPCVSPSTECAHGTSAPPPGRSATTLPARRNAVITPSQLLQRAETTLQFMSLAVGGRIAPVVKIAGAAAKAAAEAPTAAQGVGAAVSAAAVAATQPGTPIGAAAALAGAGYDAWTGRQAPRDAALTSAAAALDLVAGLCFAPAANVGSAVLSGAIGTSTWRQALAGSLAAGTATLLKPDISPAALGAVVSAAHAAATPQPELKSLASTALGALRAAQANAARA